MNPLGGGGSPASSPAKAASRPSGLVLLRKPAGVTSFQALSPLKRALGTGKVGHAGTLDKFASGLLVVLVGPYSRLNEFVSAGMKEYSGTVRFGAETATLDPEGEVVAEAPPPPVAALEEALRQFRGPIMQRPPAYSALHVDGERAYERALRGEALEMAPRKVVISELELQGYDGRDAKLRVVCSAGTYIRSLARDIALECGSRAHLAALERRAIGPFRLEEAVEAEGFDPARDLRRLGSREAAALGLGALLAEGDAALRFVNGQPLRELALRPWAADTGERDFCAVFSADETLLGIVERREGELRYRLVLGSAP